MPHINGFLGCVVLAALAVQAGGVVNFPSPQFSNVVATGRLERGSLQLNRAKVPPHFPLDRRACARV
jgi:hypothetical protein